jgi:predicted nucleotidyltransferase
MAVSCVAEHAHVPYSGGMTKPPLKRAEVIERVRAAEQRIAALGVRRLALFGSVVRDEARADSDVDLLVEFAPARKTFDNFLALSELLEHLLDHPVELLTIESLSPYIGPHILAEAEDVVRTA